MKPELFLKPIILACLLYNPSQIVYLLKKSQNVKNLAFFGKIFGVFQKRKNSTKFLKSISNFFCSRVLKTLKTGFSSAKKDGVFNKQPRKIKKTMNMATFIYTCTKSFYCPRILKTFRIWPFLENYIDNLKKAFQNFQKLLILRVYFQTRLERYCCSCVLKTLKTLDFLEKEIFFFQKNTWKFSKTLNTDTFL